MQPQRPQLISALKVLQQVNMSRRQRAIAHVRTFLDRLCFWRPTPPAPPVPRYFGFEEEQRDR